MAAKNTALKRIHVDDLVKEAGRIKSHIRGVTNELENPELELGTSVRLSVQQRELEAYLRGILFALGDEPPWKASLEREA